MAVELEKNEIQSIVPSIQRYMKEEFELDVGEMQAGFLLKYFLAEIAPFAYNSGVRDAERYFQEKIEDLTGSCYEPTLKYWASRKKKKDESKPPDAD